MQGAAIAQLINTLAHLAAGVVWYLYWCGYDAFDQGPHRANGYKWLIFYVVLLVLDVIESAVAGATKAARPLVQHVVYHWVADVLSGVALLNHFLSSSSVGDARATLQWATLPVFGVVLYLALEIASVYRASDAYAQDSDLTPTSKAQRRTHR